MTQRTLQTNGPGLIPFPRSEIPVKNVTVWMHDSGLIVVHDYSCPVCREGKAMLELNTGLMQPCHVCQQDGYKVVKNEILPWYKRIWRALVL